MNANNLKALSVAEFLNPVEVFDPDDSIAKVIGFMRSMNFYEVFVEENDKAALVTLRDILNVKDITTTKLSGVMNYIPKLNKNNTVEDAASLMFEYRIRSLPVYENSKVLGQINAISILKRLMDTKQNVRPGNIMTPNPTTVDPSDEVAKARNIMIRRRVDHIPIVKDSKLLGIVTSSEIVFNMIPASDRAQYEGPPRKSRFEGPVTDYTPEVTVSNDTGDSLNDVFDNMVKERSNYSVMTTFDEVQGIITTRDFMRMISHQKADQDSIPMYIVGLPEDPFEAEASREKFARIVSLLRRSNPQISEARAIIKSGLVKGATRRRFEVQIFILTPRDHYSYKAAAFDLPDAFDEIHGWSRKLVERFDEPRKKPRVRADPGSPSGQA